MSLYSCSATFSHFNFTYQSRYIRVYCIKTTSDSVIVCTVKWTIHFARQIVFVKTTDLYTRMHHVHFECHLTGLFFLKCGNQMIDLGLGTKVAFKKVKEYSVSKPVNNAALCNVLSSATNVIYFSSVAYNLVGQYLVIYNR